MSIQRVFAFDLGASGGKSFAGLFENGRFTMTEIHRFSHEGVPFYIADRTGQVAERAVWDDTLIYHNILMGLHAYRREVSDTLDSIGIDTWGADGHIISADGDMLGKMYCYRDHRLDAMCDEVKARIPAARVYEITGIHFQPFNISNQLLWFVRNRPYLLLPGCRFVPVPSLLYYYLGGTIKVDSSWASVTQLMEAKTRQWSDEMLSKLGIPRSIMPEIVAPGTPVGRLLAPLAAQVGLNTAALTAVGAHDTASAFAAAPVDNPDTALIISSGTWSLVGRLVPEPITNAAALAVNLSNEGGIGNIRLLKNCMGGWLVQELRRAWRNADGRETEWPELYRLAAATPAFGAFIDPDDTAFYNPSNMENAMAEFCKRTGQVAPKDRGGYVRMAYESLALKYRAINEDINRVSGTTTGVVHIVGGGSRNEMLNQFTANACGVPVLAGPVEATAVGNIMVQAMGLGIVRSMLEAMPLIKTAFPIREYHPVHTAAWDQAFARFKTVQAGTRTGNAQVVKATS